MLPSRARSPPREDKSLYEVRVSDTIYHEDMHHIEGIAKIDSRFINSIVRHSMCNRVSFLKYMHSIKQGLHVLLIFFTGILLEFFHSITNLSLQEKLLHAKIMVLIKTVITKRKNLMDFKVLYQ